jgi:HAE1 family hydrophobic/amphiphilic exporter-1
MQKLAELCIKRPVFATVLIMLLVVIGAAGFFQLGVDRFPNVDFATVTISTTQPGASPESIETEITEKVEEAVNAISGIDELRSYSNEGVSTVIVSFVLEKDVDVAVQEVRDKVSLVLNELPEDAEQPIIQKFDTGAAPVLGLVLTGTGSIGEVSEYADKTLRRRLESTSGVGSITVLGGRGRQINIYLDAYKMRGYNVTVTDVTNAIRQQNVDIPGGRIDQGARSLTVRTKGRLRNVSEFAKVSIKAQNGGAILLSDIARVEDGIAEAESVAEINGKPTVYLQISKQSGANTVAVIDSIKSRLKELEPSYTANGYTVALANDQSDYIKAAIHSVEEHLIVGSILASIVVLVFLLNWRSTFISALAIPASIIATFGLMWIMGFTLNVLTLLALTLAVGIVIDDAIVVLENIYRFIEEKGQDPFDAAVNATKEIGLAVLATTLSLVAIFIPVAFMTGIVGRFMNSFGLTMAFAIMVSLLVAFTLTPTLSARMLKAPAHKDGSKGGHGAKSGGFFGIIDRTYEAMLRWSLGHRWVIGLICIGALFSIPFIAKQIPGGFLPTDDESQFQISARAPEGTSLEETQRIARAIAARVQKIPEVDYVLASIGGGGQSAARNNASVFVRLVDMDKRERSQDELAAYVRTTILPEFAAENLRATVGAVSGVGGGVQADILYTIDGPDLAKLEEISRTLQAKLRTYPKITDVDSSYITGRPEIAAEVDRELAAQLGVSPTDVAQALNYLVGDNEVTRLEENGEQYEVHVRSDVSFRSDEEGLSLLTVPGTPEGGTGPVAIPISQVVKFTNQTGPATIQRLNRQREITIQANVMPGGNSQGAIDMLQAEFKKLDLGADYRGGPSGRSREQAKAFSAFIVAFALSIIFVYLILAAQFESWVHPITILLSLPLTIPFALLSILMFGGSLNIFSLLGILVLFGVVKKNAILQVDHTNTLREEGMERNEAIIQANRDRLRPILMTTIAFVAGMLPLVVSSGVGSGTNRAIGSVIFGGQTLSLLLTLLAIPVAYTWFDDISRFVARVRTRIFGGSQSSHPTDSSGGPTSTGIRPEVVLQAKENK